MIANEEIYSLLNSCLKAHGMIRKLDCGNKAEALEILEVLQQTAISVGEAIEKDYGLRQASVRHLEDYCELLYRIHEDIEGGNYDEKAINDVLDESDRKLEKVLLLIKRLTGADVSGQFRTYYDRPKYADEVGIFSKYKLKYKTAIVIQGPLKREDDFTLETIRLYRNLYPDCLLVLSTWSYEIEYLSKYEDERIVICLSKLPKHSGALNCNYQAVSSNVGIKKAIELGCERICKTRTDQRFYLPELFSYLEDMTDLFPLRIETLQKQRLIAISYSTQSNRPYHICDMFLYGEATDVERYFSGKSDDRDWKPIQWTDNIEYSRLRAGEAWFTTNYIESLGYNLKWTIEDSNYYLRELFLILDTSLLDLYWAKYTDSEYGERMYNDNSFDGLDFVTFFKWVKEYVR